MKTLGGRKMKKLVLSIVIASMTLSLVGCGTKSNTELEEVNKKLEDAYATIDKLEEKVDELSGKINSSGDIKLQAYTGEGQEIAAQITISYLPTLDKYEELIESVKEKAKAEGKTVIAHEKIAGERVFIIRTTETIKDITLNSLGDKFIGDFGCNIEMYLEECGIENKGNLVSELKPDEILIFTAHESEGIPSCYFSWTEPDGTTIYNTVSYDGSGEFYTYE